MDAFLKAHEFAFWLIAIPLAAFILIFFIIAPIVIFIACLFEAIRILRLVPLQADDVIRPSKALNSAIGRGFTLVGQFADEDKGFKRSLYSLALSPDRLVLLLVINRKLSGKIQLITRLPAHRWMITIVPGAVPDFSGLELIETPRRPSFEDLWQHHQYRLIRAPEIPIPFSTSTLLADIHQHDRERIDAMVKTRHARYLSPDRSKWRYTPSALLKIGWRYYRELFIFLKAFGTLDSIKPAKNRNSPSPFLSESSTTPPPQPTSPPPQSSASAPIPSSSSDHP